jgi:hypothetical protein
MRAEILDALVGGTVLAHRQAAMGADHLYVQTGIGDGIAHLLQALPAENMAKELIKGFLPQAARPAATPAMCTRRCPY